MRKPTPADAALAMGSFVLMALGTPAPAHAASFAIESFTGTACVTNTNQVQDNCITLDFKFHDVACGNLTTNDLVDAVNLGNVTGGASATKPFCFSDGRFITGAEYIGDLDCMSVNSGNQTICICNFSKLDFVAGNCGPVFSGTGTYIFADSDPITGSGNISLVGGAANAPEPPAWILFGSLLGLAGLRKITG